MFFFFLKKENTKFLVMVKLVKKNIVERISRLVKVM